MHKPVTRSFLSFSGFLYACCLTSLVTPSAHAVSLAIDTDESIQFGSTKIIQYKIDNNFKVRGWKLSSQVYIGNAKINGEWGIGLLVDKDKYAYGLNNAQASFMWRF
jgi:hypothetical protein